MDKAEEQRLRDEETRDIFKPSTPINAEYNDSTGKVICYSGMVKACHTDHIEFILDDDNPTVQIRAGNEIILVLGGTNTVFVHYYRTTILGLHQGKPLIIYGSTPQETNVSSLRCFFRCDIAIPFCYIIEKVLEFQGQTKNLSAGGLLGIVKLDSTLTVDSLVDVRFKLPDLPGPINVPSQITRIEKAPKSMMQIGVKFLKISPTQQDQIIKYLFKYEREMKSKRATY